MTTPREPHPISSAASELGEGPVWDPGENRILWIDIVRPALHRAWPDGGHEETMLLASSVGCVALAEGQGLILALRDGLHLAPAFGASPRPLVAAPWTARNVRFNDGKPDPRGRLWVGSMADDGATPVGSLFRLDPGHELTRILTGVTVSNGLGWSPDGKTMYYVDTGTGGIDAFDYDVETGDARQRRRLVDVDRRDGLPDGLCVAVDGGIWVGLWGGGALRHYSPSGRLRETVVFPVPNVTSCAFGGEGLGTLFVTTARAGMRQDELAAMPDAGRLFVMIPDAPGLPVARVAPVTNHIDT